MHYSRELFLLSRRLKGKRKKRTYSRIEEVKEKAMPIAQFRWFMGIFIMVLLTLGGFGVRYSLSTQAYAEETREKLYDKLEQVVKKDDMKKVEDDVKKLTSKVDKLLN
jgi:hypothetical protein